MNDALLVIGFIVFWIVLNRWVLPRFGVQTCMSGACGPRAQQPERHNTLDKVVHDPNTLHEGKLP